MKREKVWEQLQEAGVWLCGPGKHCGFSEDTRYLPQPHQFLLCNHGYLTKTEPQFPHWKMGQYTYRAGLLQRLDVM